MEEENLKNKIKKMLLEQGASDVGFATHPNGYCGLLYSVTIVVALSKAVVRQITDAPPPQYFHHYRSVNALLDHLALLTGQMLSAESYEYFPIAASQSINTDGWKYRGAFSHKEAAVRSGLGRIGRHALFIHSKFGAGVRLATVFTSCNLGSAAIQSASCGSCRACVSACPAMALTGAEYIPGEARETIFDASACSHYMKEHFQNSGRGSVCGICMRTCMQAQGILKNS